MNEISSTEQRRFEICCEVSLEWYKNWYDNINGKLAISKDDCMQFSKSVSWNKKKEPNRSKKTSDFLYFFSSSMQKEGELLEL